MKPGLIDVLGILLFNVTLFLPSISEIAFRCSVAFGMSEAEKLFNDAAKNPPRRILGKGNTGFER